MVGKNNNLIKNSKSSERVQRFSLRKLSVGVVSVAVATGFYLGSGTTAQAATNDTEAAQTETVQNSDSTSNTSTDSSTTASEEKTTTTETGSTSADSTSSTSTDSSQSTDAAATTEIKDQTATSSSDDSAKASAATVAVQSNNTGADSSTSTAVTKDVNGVQTTFSREKSATTGNSDANMTANESGEYWPDTKGNSITKYEKTTKTDFSKSTTSSSSNLVVDPTKTDYDSDYSDTPNLLHNQDLHLYINGKEVNVSDLKSDDDLNSDQTNYPGHNSKGHSRLISVSDFGSNTYFYARNAVQKTNQITGAVESYDAKWTLESMNYTNEQALLAFGIKGIVDKGGTTLFNVGSGWQVAKRGNFANTHLQFFKEVNTDNFVNQDGTLKESVDDAIKNGDIVATTLKIHEGFTDLDSNEAVEVPESAVHKVLVDNNSTLAYQKTDDGYLAITRTYGDISDHDAKYGNSNTVAALLELDVPVEGIDLSIATVGPSNTSSSSELAEGSKVAPAVLNTASYLKELDVNFYQLDENGNATTIKLADTKIAHNFIGKSYGVQNTDADGDGNQDDFDYSASATLTDKNGDTWTLVSGKTSGNNVSGKPSYQYQDCLNVINYYYQKSQKVQQGTESVTYKFYNDRNKTKLVKESTWTPVYSGGKWQWQVLETSYDDQGNKTTTTTTQSAAEGLTADQATVKFTGTVNYDTTGKITGTTWDNSSLTYGTIKTPVVDGYTADLSSVGGDTVAPDTTLNRSYVVEYTPYEKVSEPKPVKRTITYQDTDKKPVNGSPDGKSSYVQEVTFTRTALKDNNGKIVGYDKNGDGKVDTTDASAAWVTSKDSMDEVVSKTPSSVGYDMVDKSSVAGVSNITPD
ncbi:YSIRK-type signal peptide-containing protein, partial [Lactobacillus equicursoris]